MEERAKFILAGYGFVLTVLLINLKLIYDDEVAGYQERIKNFTGDDESKKIPKIQCVMTFFIKFLAKHEKQPSAFIQSTVVSELLADFYFESCKPENQELTQRRSSLEEVNCREIRVNTCNSDK